MDKTVFLIIASLLIALIVIVLFLVNMLKNSLKKIKNNYLKMDEALKKRWDALPRYVQCFKKYFEEEKETIEEILRLRNTTYNNMKVKKREAVNERLKVHISNLLSFADKYPELKKDGEFLELNQKFLETEENITYLENRYIESIEKYNKMVKRFPLNVVAKIFDFKKVEIGQMRGKDEKKHE